MDKLAQACESVMNDWFATFPEVIPEPEYSKKHERWKKRLFNKMRDGYYHRFTTGTIKVMLVAAVLCALTLTAFVVPSSREFILEKFDEYTAFQLTEDNKNSVNGEIIVGYIPEGYAVESKGNVGKNVYIKFNSSTGDGFTVFKSSSSAKVDFNTEFYDTEEFIIADVNYVYCKGNQGLDNLIWTKNDYIYRISGPFALEELIKIAELIH